MAWMRIGSLAALAACVPSASALAAIEVADYFPLAVGHSWQYDVTDSGVESAAARVVEGRRDIGGVNTYEVVHRFSEGYTERHWLTQATGLQRHGWSPEGWGFEEMFDLPLTVLPATIDFTGSPVAFGTSAGFTGSGSGATWNGTWTVSGTVNGFETVTVGAGTFEALVIEWVDTWTFSDGGGDSEWHTLYLAKDVGVVREVVRIPTIDYVDGQQVEGFLETQWRLATFTVPEPTAAMLLAGGALLMACRRR